MVGFKKLLGSAFVNLLGNFSVARSETIGPTPRARTARLPYV